MKRADPAEIHLQQLGIDNASDIDLEAIAYCRGAQVRYRTLEGCEARIFGTPEKAIITIDPARGPKRARFSLGHELGHWHHHRGRAFACLHEDIGNPKFTKLDPERVADGYSADLLMPRFLFRPASTALPTVTFGALSHLADDFQTSLTATAIRFVELGTHPVLLVCHGPRGRKWFRRSPMVPEHWFPQEHADPDSCVVDALKGTSSGRPQKIGADAWFDRSGADRYELKEQAVQIADTALCLLLLTDSEMT